MSHEKTQASSLRYWAVIPAAGIGSRMSADRPKQYLPLAGKTVLEHSLQAMLSHEAIAGAVVAISAQDSYWQTLDFRTSKPLWTAQGGRERCDSVMNALALLAQHAHEQDWVLVHDAARPCVSQRDISALLEACRAHPVGGLLAVPVKDTIKRAQQGSEGYPEVLATVDRDGLWQAQTPQMFRIDALRQALSGALTAGMAVTDEASAMEWAGYPPLLVTGNASNIKITQPEDLDLASYFLARHL